MGKITTAREMADHLSLTSVLVTISVALGALLYFSNSPWTSEGLKTVIAILFTVDAILVFWSIWRLLEFSDKAAQTIERTDKILITWDRAVTYLKSPALTAREIGDIVGMFTPFYTQDQLNALNREVKLVLNGSIEPQIISENQRREIRDIFSTEMRKLLKKS